tara:strand:- start:229 stop:1020 length:792 start_codon:yes stop_codon:yes gene_type:complete
MNIAITMSGVSRYPKKSYLNLKNQIITPLQDKGCNVKVFIHTWDTKTVVDQKWGYNDSSEKRNYENDFKLSKEWYKKNKELDIKDTIHNIIEVEDFLMEDNKSYTKTFDKIRSSLPTASMISPFNLISSLYSKYRVFLLKEKYELENNIDFDIVIRHRTELNINVKNIFEIINFSKENNTLVLPHWKLWDDKTKSRIPDFTLIGPPKLTNIIDSVYNAGLNKYIRRSEDFNSHTLMSVIMNKHNIPYTSLGDSKFYLKNFFEK